MKNWMRIAIGLVVVGAVVAVGAYAWVTRPLEEASENVQANTQQLEAGTDEAVVFRISQEQSTASYIIEEVLVGRGDVTVVGTTNEVAGDILVDFGDVSASEVGQIRINARTFQTDDNRRDNAVGRSILRSENDANEFIEFVPTALNGLPETVELGDTIEFQIIGDLTVAGETREVTFATTATYTSDTIITGSAEVTITYADFNINIPNVPIVASVEDTVILRIEFLAERVADTA